MGWSALYCNTYRTLVLYYRGVRGRVWGFLGGHIRRWSEVGCHGCLQPRVCTTMPWAVLIMKDVEGGCLWQNEGTSFVQRCMYTGRIDVIRLPSTLPPDVSIFSRLRFCDRDQPWSNPSPQSQVKFLLNPSWSINIKNNHCICARSFLTPLLSSTYQTLSIQGRKLPSSAGKGETTVLRQTTKFPKAASTRQESH